MVCVNCGHKVVKYNKFSVSHENNEFGEMCFEKDCLCVEPVRSLEGHSLEK